jgi:hypothetical protein
VGETQRVEPIEALLDSAAADRIHGLAVFAALALDRADLDRLDPRVLLQHAEGIAALDRAVLTDVSGEHDPGVFLFRHLEDLGHASGAEKARLVDPDHLVLDRLLELLVDQEAGHGVRVLEPLGAEDPSRGRRRRGEGESAVTSFLNSADGLLHERRLSHAGATAHHHDAALRVENVLHSSLLLGIQEIHGELEIKPPEALAGAPAISGEGDHRLLFLQDAGFSPPARWISSTETAPTP